MIWKAARTAILILQGLVLTFAWSLILRWGVTPWGWIWCIAAALACAWLYSVHRFVNVDCPHGGPPRRR